MLMDTVNLNLETLGTLGATGGGIVAMVLLVRQLWKLVTGQIAEQRLLLADSRTSRDDVITERNDLREQNRLLQERCDRNEAEQRAANEALREELHEERIKRRQWAEGYSELVRYGIENGLKVSEMPNFPSRDRKSVSGLD